MASSFTNPGGSPPILPQQPRPAQTAQSRMLAQRQRSAMTRPPTSFTSAAPGAPSAPPAARPVDYSQRMIGVNFGPGGPGAPSAPAPTSGAPMPGAPTDAVPGARPPLSTPGLPPVAPPMPGAAPSAIPGAPPMPGAIPGSPQMGMATMPQARPAGSPPILPTPPLSAQLQKQAMVPR